MTSVERPEQAVPRRATSLPRVSPRARRLLRVGQRWAFNLSVAAFYFWFAKAHFVGWVNSGELRGLGVVLIETVVAVLIIVRRTPIETSGRMIAWVATVVAILGPMLARSTPGGWPIGTYLQIVGAAFALFSLFTLRRSFGLVAANRGIVTAGPYGLVRHPIYIAYFVAYLGYLSENPSMRNVAVLTIATAAQLIRISCEEEVLTRDPEYAAYRRRVRYRLVPYIY